MEERRRPLEQPETKVKKSIAFVLWVFVLWVLVMLPPSPSSVTTAASAVVKSTTLYAPAVFNNYDNWHSTTWYAPAVYNNYNNWYSAISIQNNSDSPQRVDWKGYVAGSAVCSGYENVAAHGWVNFGASGCPTGLIIGVMASGSNGNIVLTVRSYTATPNLASFEYTGIPSSEVWDIAYVAGIQNSYRGWNSDITVMNTGSSATNITITYGTGQWQTYSNLPAHSSVNFYTPNSGIPSGAITGARVQGENGSAVAVVVTDRGPNNGALAHVGRHEGASSIEIPRVMSGYYRTDTAVECVEIGLADMTTITYANGGRQSKSVHALQNVEFYTPDVKGPGTLTRATVNGANLVCYVSGDRSGDASGVDHAWAYSPTDGGYLQTPTLGGVLCGNDCTYASNEDTLFEMRWGYDYSSSKAQWRASSDVEYVPMVYGTFVPSTASDSTWLMGANEPNVPGQAGGINRIICPSNYLGTWHLIVSNFSSSRKLVSPAVATLGFGVNGIDCGYGPGTPVTGFDWLKDFVFQYRSKYGSDGINALAVHCYWDIDPVTNNLNYHECQNQISKIIGLANTYGIPEVWVTEFNTGIDYGANCYEYYTEKYQCERDFIDWMSVQPKITRISWFTDRTYDDQITYPGLVRNSGAKSEYGNVYWMYR